MALLPKDLDDPLTELTEDPGIDINLDAAIRNARIAIAKKVVQQEDTLDVVVNAQASLVVHSRHLLNSIGGETAEEQEVIRKAIDHMLAAHAELQIWFDL